MNKPELFNETNRATYCPEDDKLRLYVGRVPRDEYLALKAEGWTNTPKQSEAGQGEFAATWTPSRRDTAISYAGIIEDEDAGPEERAADRAERFGGYRDKRESEALGHADAYDAGPQAFGFQSKARAVRAADRHDRIAGRAVDAWEKAEYWTRRTAGVIHHALYKSTPAVRIGRIKTLEAALRKHEASREDHRKIYEAWQKVAEMEGADVLLPLDGGEMNPAQRLAYDTANTGGYHMSLFHPDGGEIDENGKRIHGNYFHGFSAYDFLTHDTYGGGVFRRLTPKEYALHFLAKTRHPDAYGMDWKTHYELRLAYENQMLEAQGGRLAHVEIEKGGRIGGKLIYKVNKSTATGRVTSVSIIGPKVQGWTYRAENLTGTEYGLYQFDTERMQPDAYTPPTPESLAELAQIVAQHKGREGKPQAIPLVNPTDDDAQRLLDMWNERGRDRREEAQKRRGYADEFKPGQILRMTQAQYSQISGGTYSSAETCGIRRDGVRESRSSNLYNDAENKRAKLYGRPVCKIRITGGYGWHSEPSIIILTDKPQKPLPVAVWELPAPQPEPANA